MGLGMTLGKEHNPLYYDFRDAYWVVSDIHYTPGSVGFSLECYPSREARHLAFSEIPEKSIGIGGTTKSIYDSILYSWCGEFTMRDILPLGIPLDADQQKTAIYNWMKTYNGLPFEDVFEKE